MSHLAGNSVVRSDPTATHQGLEALNILSKQLEKSESNFQSESALSEDKLEKREADLDNLILSRVRIPSYNERKIKLQNGLTKEDRERMIANEIRRAEAAAKS